MPSSSVSQSSRKPAARARGEAHRQPSPLASGRPCLVSFCDCSPCARRVLWVLLLLRSRFAAKSHLILLNYTYQLPLKG